jgi:hypothetical protein
MFTDLPKPISVAVKVASCIGNVVGEGTGEEVPFRLGDEFIQKAVAGADLAIVNDASGRSFSIESRFLEETARCSWATDQNLVAV